MKANLTRRIAATFVAACSIMVACEKKGETIYVDDPYIPTLSLELKSSIPEKLYLSDTLEFSVDIASRFASLASLEAAIIIGDEKITSIVIPTAKAERSETFEGLLTLPFTPNIPDGLGTLRFTAVNKNGGKRDFDYAIAIERPDFDNLILVHSRGNYTVPRTARNQYCLETVIPADPDAYLQTPPFGPKNKVLQFRLNDRTGGVKITDDATAGIPIGHTPSGKSVVSLNTLTMSYSLPQHSYLYSVRANDNDGTPPAESPFYEVVLSRNKKALDSRNRSGNRITYPWGGVVRFAINPGSQVLDGFSGNARSTITAPNVMVNLGSKKVINGKPCFFGFSFPTTNGQQSGWIYEECVNDPYNMEICGADFRIDLTPAQVCGDAPIEYSVVAADTAPWAELKVRRGISRAENVAVSDYLNRGDGTVYLLYALPYFGGYANEAVIGNGEPVFIPDAGVPHMILPVFLPSDPIQADIDAYADPAKHQIEWVFGRIGTSRGWSPILNLQIKKAEK